MTNGFIIFAVKSAAVYSKPEDVELVRFKIDGNIRHEKDGTPKPKGKHVTYATDVDTGVKYIGNNVSLGEDKYMMEFIPALFENAENGSYVEAGVLINSAYETIKNTQEVIDWNARSAEDKKELQDLFSGAKKSVQLVYDAVKKEVPSYTVEQAILDFIKE